MTIDAPHSPSMVSELIPASSLASPQAAAPSATPPALSPNTQAILLLTAPLITGRSGASPDLLTPGEYKRLAKHLRDTQHQPMDLIASGADAVCASSHFLIEKERLQRLLSRGFLLSQALEQWQSRAIWVLSRADAQYPRRLKARLREDAPALLYGCGDLRLLDAGGLAVVGSRHVDDSLIAYTEAVGALAASTPCNIVSGGAKGIDQAAMRGALQAGGTVCGVLADSLQRAVMLRENRDALLAGRLLLISPWDPSAGFNVGHAMQRNKLIYALADAALVVNSDKGKGGTWAGATEQLDKLRLVPVYVRASGIPSDGLEGLRGKGALLWPEPKNATDLNAALDALPPGGMTQTPVAATHEPIPSSNELHSSPPQNNQVNLLPAPTQVLVTTDVPINPAQRLLDTVTEIVCKNLESPKKEAEIAALLDVTPTQARAWLQRLLDAGVIEKNGKPARFGIKSSDLFH